MRVSLAVFCLLASNLTRDRLVNAITETEDELVMRDASSSKERPRITEYDMTED